MFSHDTSYAEKQLARRKIDPRNESDLISLLKTSEDGFIVSYAIQMLNACGFSSSGCIPALKDVSRHTMQDVQIMAVYTLVRIAGASEIDFYRGILSSKDRRPKYAAVSAIATFGDKSDIEAMTLRFKRLVASRQVRGGETELCIIVRFLEEFAEQSVVAKKALEYLRTRMDRLGPWEQSDIPRISPTLSSDREWILLILPRVEERIRLRNLVFSWIEPKGLFATCPTDPRFASAVKRWLPLSRQVLILGEETAKQARASSAALHATIDIAIVELPAYVSMRFKNGADFISTAQSQEIAWKKMVLSAVC